MNDVTLNVRVGQLTGKRKVQIIHRGSSNRSTSDNCEQSLFSVIVENEERGRQRWRKSEEARCCYFLGLTSTFLAASHAPILILCVRSTILGKTNKGVSF